MKRFEYFKPRSLEEAWELRDKIPDSLFIAGGTDVLVSIRNDECRPQALISLRSIAGLDGVEIDDAVRIGALTAINDIIYHPQLGRQYPVLVEAAQSLGSVQIRNVATIGGNLCNASPCADMALPLLVLEATIRLQSPKETREVPVSEFFKGPGAAGLSPPEILTDILLKPLPKNTKTCFLKKGRVNMDLAVASVAVLLEMEGKRCRKARIAAGSVASIPLRLKKAEAVLEGAAVSSRTMAKAQQLAEDEIVPITDIRSSEEYRRQITGILVKRALERALDWSQA